MADYKTIASNMIKLSPVTHFPTELVESDTPDSTPPTRQRHHRAAHQHSYHTRYQKKHRGPLHIPAPEARFYPIEVVSKLFIDASPFRNFVTKALSQWTFAVPFAASLTSGYHWFLHMKRRQTSKGKNANTNAIAHCEWALYVWY